MAHVLDVMDKVPFPKRPGTLWEMDAPRDRCKNCGQAYRSHGAPAGEPEKHGLPAGTPPHLMCRWSEKEWQDYQYALRVATYEGARAEVIRALEALKGHDATVPLNAIVALLPDKPEWSTR